MKNFSRDSEHENIHLIFFYNVFLDCVEDRKNDPHLQNLKVIFRLKWSRSSLHIPLFIGSSRLLNKCNFKSSIPFWTQAKVVQKINWSIKDLRIISGYKDISGKAKVSRFSYHSVWVRKSKLEEVILIKCI